MISERADRLSLGWSYEQLARASMVEVASIYLLERTGTAGQHDDILIRHTLAREKAKRARRHVDRAANDLGTPRDGRQANDNA